MSKGGNCCNGLTRHKIITKRVFQRERQKNDDWIVCYCDDKSTVLKFSGKLSCFLTLSILDEVADVWSPAVMFSFFTKGVFQVCVFGREGMSLLWESSPPV